MQPAPTFGRRGVVAAAAPQFARRGAPPQPTPQPDPPLGELPASDQTFSAPWTASSSTFSFLWTLFFSFEGRLARGDYRLIRFAGYAIFLGILFTVYQLMLQQKASGGDVGTMLLLLLVDFVAALLWVWTTIAVQVKRWHDRDKSGVWMFVGFIPFIGQFWVLVELMFLDGTQGPNQFGPSPRGDPTAVFET